MLKRLHHFDG